MKETGLSQLKCGNCKHDSFRIYQKGNESGPIHIECEKCLSSTIIGTTDPKLVLLWGENSEGILCKFYQ